MATGSLFTPVRFGETNSSVKTWNAHHAQWLKKHPHMLRDIGRQTVRNQDMSGIDLSRVMSGSLSGESDWECNQLEDAILREARIHANFSHSRMDHVDMTDCVAHDSNFSHISGVGINFTRADMSGADFSGAHLEQPVMTNGNFYRASFWGATVLGLEMREAMCMYILWKDAMLTDADFSHALINQCDFSGASLRGSDFTDSSSMDTKLVGADLRGARFVKTDFMSFPVRQSTLFSEADVRGADFSGNDAAHFSKSNFFGARYNDATRFPAGVDPLRLGMCKLASGADYEPASARAGVQPSLASPYMGPVLLTNRRP